MSRSAADALAVLALARVAGLQQEDGSVQLDVAPLFETVADLEAAETSLRSLFADPVYREHLRQRGQRQMVMLGIRTAPRTAASSPRAGRCSERKWCLPRWRRRAASASSSSTAAVARPAAAGARPSAR
jgi:phosphoenolpyruvate carboxylase